MKTSIPVLFAMALAGVFSCSPKYPVIEKGDVTDDYFGVKVADPYRALEDDNSEQTEKWVKAQNRVTERYLSRIGDRPAILSRLKEVADYEKTGCPSRKANGKWYFYHNDGLQNQSVLFETPYPGGEASVLLDPNRLSEDGTVALKGTYFSKDCKYMAYAVSRSGSDWQEFYVMDVEKRELLPDHIQWAKFSGAAWCGDGFYYSAYDAPVDGHAYSGVNEGHKVYYHRIGTSQDQDVLFYQNRKYPRRFYTVSVNEEQTMMFLYEDGELTGNNLYVKDLRRPGSDFVKMSRDMVSRYEPVETDGDRIYILTNSGAPMYRLAVADIRFPAEKNWKDAVPERDCVLEDVTFVADRMILSYARDASTHAYMRSSDGKEDFGEIKLPGIGSASFAGRKDYPGCFYSFSSFTVPGTVYSLDIKTGESKVFAEPRTAFDLSDFITEQVFFESHDGTRVPMFITRRKDIVMDGSNPVLQYGYGGFNISLSPSFSVSRVPFLESGGIYVMVNLRGGGEYGEEWHLAGTKLRKKNVFEDFIAASEWLIANGYTSPEKLAMEGGSNGGLLVGACMTMRPDLFAVAVPRVGVMDMLRYHRFTIGWNWASDYGTSEDSPEMFEYLYSYSPLHNIRKGTDYPATLVTTADHDDRVVPAHSFKFAATLQECSSGKRPAFIRIDDKAGHGGGKPMTKVLEEQADILAFIMKNLGMVASFR